MHKILYVDDEPSLLELAKHFIEKMGEFSIDTCTSAHEALDRLKTIQYDLILSDYQMPDIDGIAFLKQIKATGNSTPFIIFTGRGREEVVIEALNNGADYYLQKGGEPKSQFTELVHKIRQAISKRQAEEELRAAYEQITASQEELEGQFNELAKSEQRIRESEAELQAIIENTSDIVASYDRNIRLLVFNRACSEVYRNIFGIELRPGLCTLDFFPESDRGFWTANNARVLAGESFTAEFSLPARGGQVRLFECSFNPIHKDNEVVGFSTFTRDITERKIMENVLREREIFLKETQQIARLGGWKANPHTDYLEWTDGVYDIIEAPRDYRPGLSEGMKYYAPEDIPFIREKVAVCLATGEPFAIEARIITETGKKVWTEVRGLAPIIDGIRSYVIGTIQDITDRKLAHEALHESEEKYRTVIEQSHDGIFIAQDGLLVFHNPSFATLTGYSSAELARRSIADLIAPEDREVVLTRHRERLLGKALPESYEFSVLHHDGTSRIRVTMNISSATIHGKPATIGTLHNVMNERKREETLKASEERFRRLLSSSFDAVVVHQQGRIVLANDAAARINGVSSTDELIGKPVLDLVYPEFRAKVAERIQTMSELSDGTVPLIEEKFVRSDGTAVDVEVMATATQHEGQPAVMVVFRDISERKKAERELQLAYQNLAATEEDLREQFEELAQSQEDLRESEEKYRRVIENIYAAVMIHNADTSIRMINKTALDLMGLTYDEAIGRIAPDHSWHFIRGDGSSLPLADYPVNYVLSTGKPLRNMEAGIFRRHSQDTVWVLVNADPEYDKNGTISAVFITFTDITNRKGMETVLQHQTETLGILNEIISAVNKAEDLPQLLSSILDESLRLLDFDAGGIYLVDRSTRTANVVHSKNLPKELLAEIQTAPIDKKPYDTLFIKNEPIITENYAQIAPDRSMKFGFKSIASIPLISKGVAIGALNLVSARRHVISDEEKQTLISISTELGSTIERMAAEEEENKAKKNLETLFNSIDEMVFVLDMQGGILAVNDAVLKCLSYTSDELIGTNVLLLHVPERRDEALRIVQGMIAGTIGSCPVPVLAKNGTRIEVETKVTRGWWNGNEVLIGVTRDITERKRVEVALEESERQYRDIIENIQDMVYRADMNGKFTMVNPSGARLVGLESPDQLVGRDVADRYVNPDDRKAFLEALKQNGSVYEYPITLKAVDGTIRHVTSSSHFFYDVEGVVQGVEGVIHDVTDLVRAEEAFKLANRKLNLLYSITRHDINNQLTVLLGYLTILKNKQPDPALTEYFQKLNTAAQRISSMIQFTREYENLGVNAPAWQNCRTVVNTAEKEVPLGKIVVKNDLPSCAEVFADQLIVKVCYNLVDNAMRYGGKITTIRFSVEEAGDDHLIVCEDDGDGVVAEEKENIFKRGFGKNTGLGLALAREILSITGITIRESGEPGKGARFEMTVPKGMWRMNPNSNDGPKN